MSIQKTIKEVRRAFEERKYHLLSNVYVGAHSKLEFLCPLEHKDTIMWTTFQQGGGCRVCAQKSRNEKNRMPLQQIKERFQQEGYELLSNTYINSSIELKFECPRGHIEHMCWSFFQRGCRCPKCAGKRMTIDFIREYFQQQNYTLLSSEYKGSRADLEYICPKGHTGSTKWNIFQQGRRCPECSRKKCGQYRKLTFEWIEEQFKQEGYTLFPQKYCGSASKMQYLCPKKHQGSISWDNFKQGYRCPLCQEWQHEIELGKVLEQIFPDKVRRQDNLDFLGRQSVDFSVRKLKIAFEYDGEQHFRPVRYGGMSLKQAKKNFKLQQERDARKNKLCKENGYKLIRVAYYEDLILENIQKKTDEVVV